VETLAGVVDQDVDATEAHYGRIDQPPDLFGISKVRLDREGVRELAGELGNPVGSAGRKDYLCAASGGKTGRCRADPGGRTRHYDDGTVELHEAPPGDIVRPATRAGKWTRSA